MTTIRRWLKLNVEYRKIGGMHFVWLGPVGFSCWRKRRA